MGLFFYNKIGSIRSIGDLPTTNIIEPNLIDDIRYLFKDADYSYENEYRIIKSYEGKEDVIFSSESSNSVIPGLYAYIDTELKYSKIKLGPKCDDIDFVAPYIKYVDRNIEVTKSQISYR